MTESGGISIDFTNVLYGVVVANAIYQLDFAISVHNAMLLFALGLIIGDWIEYRISVQKVHETARNYAVALVLDVIILIVWFLITIVPTGRIDWFFIGVAVFFFIQAVWDVALLALRLNEIVRRAHAHLVGAFLVLAALAWQFSPSAWILLAIGTVVFLGRKSVYWRQLLRESPERL